MPGAEIRWINPYNYQNVLLHPSFVAPLIGEASEEKAHLEKGYIPLSKAAGQIGIDVGTLRVRVHTIRPEEDYLPDGTRPKRTPGEVTLKGAALRWSNPANKNLVLLHPDYVKGQVAAQEKMRSLLAQGYRSIADVTKDIGMQANSLHIKTKTAIEAGKDYLPNGGIPAGEPGEEILPGAEIRWRHPYSSTTVLLHPHYIARLKSSADKEKELRAKGYRALGEVEKETGIAIPADESLGDRTGRRLPHRRPRTFGGGCRQHREGFHH
ncbi:MAG: hypothetical protein WDN72_09245 [Alphaproteobacteria bacterium]